VREELDAIMRSKVAHVIHVGRMPHAELARTVVLAPPTMTRFREKYEPPFIATLYRPEEKTRFRMVAGPLRMALAEERWRAGVWSLGGR
jgi:hypothetical protein